MNKKFTSSLIALGLGFSISSMAVAQDKLIVYTSMKESLIGALKTKFNEKYPDIAMDYQSAGAGKLMAKIDADQRLHKYQIDYDTAIQELNDAKQAENIAVFIGAGISKFVEPKYPIWNEVTAKLKNELPNCTINDALDIAQAYSDQFGGTRLAETVSSLFPDCSSNIDFYHELLKCRPKYLITTNWDNMLQKTIESEAYMYDTIADDKELMDSKLFNKYIKMHGDFQHKFVLTRSSYNSY